MGPSWERYSRRQAEVGDFTLSYPTTPPYGVGLLMVSHVRVTSCAPYIVRTVGCDVCWFYIPSPIYVRTYVHTCSSCYVVPYVSSCSSPLCGVTYYLHIIYIIYYFYIIYNH